MIRPIKNIKCTWEQQYRKKTWVKSIRNERGLIIVINEVYGVSNKRKHFDFTLQRAVPLTLYSNSISCDIKISFPILLVPLYIVGYIFLWLMIVDLNWWKPPPLCWKEFCRVTLWETQASNMLLSTAWAISKGSVW